MHFSGLFVLAFVAAAHGTAIELNVPIIQGTYELSRTENFEPYMKALGVGFVMRNLAAAATPTTTITKNNDGSWHFRTVTTFTSSDITFTLGVPFTETTPDGRTCTSTITAVNDHKFDHVQKNCGGGPDGLLITRDFTGSELKMVLTAPSEEGEIVCRRDYRKL